MNSIKLNGGTQVEAERTAGRLEAERVTEGNVTPQQTTPAPPKISDSISVSERAAAISELTARAEQLPDVREERVEALRALVQAGEYQPTATQIADAILKDAQRSTDAI
jgi:flagellar biosynthesis anti-sigma factor FlgM